MMSGSQPAAASFIHNHPDVASVGAGWRPRKLADEVCVLHM